MPILSTNDMGGAVVRRLDSTLYAGNANKAAGGLGVSDAAFAEMNRLMNGRRLSYNALEALITNHQIPVGDGRLHKPFEVDRNGREINGGMPLQIQNRAITQVQLNEEIRNGIKLRQTRGGGGAVIVPVRSPVTAAQVKKTIDMNTLASEVRAYSRNAFTTSQVLTVTTMIAEWLTLVEVLIACAEAAEKNLVSIVDGINAERQAMWKLAGDIISTVLLFAAPPPFGVIIGSVVKAVLSSDTWGSCLTSASGGVMSATFKGTEEQWKKDDDTNQWGPSQETVFKAMATTKSPGEQDSLDAYKDVPAVLGGVSSCMGQSAREKFEEVNKKTMMHLTDMPDPPKEQTGKAASVIREQTKQKIATIFNAVYDSISDFSDSESGPASLIYASYTYQETSLTAKMATKSDSERRAYIHDRVLEGAQLFLNTVVHEMLISLAKIAKPKFNVTTIDKDNVIKQFEIMFWAGYLGSTAMKEAKAAPAIGKGAPISGAEDYFAKRYGVIKKLVWRNTVPAKLNALGITKHYAPVKRMGFAVRTTEYESAIKNWMPPIPNRPWIPVPYQDGGSANSKGRLAAWAVEFNKRPPAEIFKAIMG